MTPRFSYRVTVGPTEDPVSLAEFKSHANLYGTDRDGECAGLLIAARDHVQQYLGRALCTQTVQMFLDAFPEGDEFDLALAPAQSVTSITYLDRAGVSQTLAPSTYVLDGDGCPARIALAANAVWPATAERIRAVTVTYVAGYGSAGAVPESIRHAIKLLASHYLENKEAVIVGQTPSEIPLGVDRLLSLYRVFN